VSFIFKLNAKLFLDSLRLEYKVLILAFGDFGKALTASPPYVF
jgi:hypothetical protein